MSAPLAGKFSDHYEVLGVDSKADATAIKNAYSKLAAQYSPTNAATGNKEKFAELNAAYEILSDPDLRRAFDGVRGSNEDSNIQFPVAEFIEDLNNDTDRRACLLALLYYRRKYEPISPGISMRQVESVMKVDVDQLAFLTWVLKQQGLIASDDKSRLLVTVAGIEYVESHKPRAEQIQAWLRTNAEQTAMRPVKPESQKQKDEAKVELPVAKPPLRPAPELTPQMSPQGMATAGLSSLRSALLKSMGPKPTPASSAPDPQDARKVAAKP